jgi:hypothetical protein
VRGLAVPACFWGKIMNKNPFEIWLKNELNKPWKTELEKQRIIAGY